MLKRKTKKTKLKCFWEYNVCAYYFEKLLIRYWKLYWILNIWYQKSQSFSDPPQRHNKFEHLYNLNVGQEEKILIEFSANPRPTVGLWTINKATVPVSGTDTNYMYVSGAFEEKVTRLKLYSHVFEDILPSNSSLLDYLIHQKLGLAPREMDSWAYDQEIIRIGRFRTT